MSKASQISEASQVDPGASGLGLDSVVPYRNGPAIIGYCCAVFGLIPGFGIVLAHAAAPTVRGEVQRA